VFIGHARQRRDSIGCSAVKLGRLVLSQFVRCEQLALEYTRLELEFTLVCVL